MVQNNVHILLYTFMAQNIVHIHNPPQNRHFPQKLGWEINGLGLYGATFPALADPRGLVNGWKIF